MSNDDQQRQEAFAFAASLVNAGETVPDEILKSAGIQRTSESLTETRKRLLAAIQHDLCLVSLINSILAGEPDLELLKILGGALIPVNYS